MFFERNNKLLNFFFQTKHGSWAAANLPPSIAGYADRGGVPIKYINGKPAALARGHVKHIKSKGKKGKKNKVKETYDLIVNIDLVSEEENFLGFMHRQYSILCLTYFCEKNVRFL